jgi:hypothetical protein
MALPPNIRDAAPVLVAGWSFSRRRRRDDRAQSGLALSVRVYLDPGSSSPNWARRQHPCHNIPPGRQNGPGSPPAANNTRQPALAVDTADRPPHLLCIMSTPHPPHRLRPATRRRRPVKARHIRQEVPAIVGPEPQSLEPDAETLTRVDKADALFRELVTQAKSG